MLQVTNQVNALLPPAISPNLAPLVGPAQNLVNGYNIAEQTCFHRTTVSHLIASLQRIVASYKATLPLLNDLLAPLQAARALIADSTALVGTLVGPPPATTLLGAVGGLLAALTGFVTTVVGFITTIVGSLGTLITATRIAAIVVTAAAVSCALFWVPVVGGGLFIAGTIAGVVALAVILWVVLAGLGTVATAIGSINTALGALTAPLGTVVTALTPVVTSLTTVRGSLATVDALITPLVSAGGSLTNCVNVLQTTTNLLDTRTVNLQAFLARPAGQAYAPRMHLTDTYTQAVKVYRAALGDLQSPQAAAVWNAMLVDPVNTIELNPTQAMPPVIDQDLACASLRPEG